KWFSSCCWVNSEKPTTATTTGEDPYNYSYFVRGEIKKWKAASGKSLQGMKQKIQKFLTHQVELSPVMLCFAAMTWRHGSKAVTAMAVSG
ncbi:hypothetical protein, partial [Phytobacter sp. V91]|uniref:hypothetical protein n=1 Tax=Phytobacter sp. V91 TaxID=3369425 RepID=UPI003F62B07F